MLLHMPKIMNYKIIIPFYNVEEWIVKCIKSLKIQEYSNFQCILVDDMSTDNTMEVVGKLIEKDSRFTYILNKSKRYALQNVADAIEYSKPNNDDIILILDGDDWLASSKVLTKLNEVYEDNNCMLTYGSYVQFPSATRGIEPSAYNSQVIAGNNFREDSWRASHLKTFKYELWTHLDLEDLKDEEGNFFKTAYDQAFMLPLLELSAERSRFIPDIMYVYNRLNPLSVDKTKTQEQYQTMLKIRKKRKYTRL